MVEASQLQPDPNQPVALIADDEAVICELARAAFEAAGFFVLTASDGDEALQISRGFRGCIHILVSDIVMPNLDGLALREQILRERPAIQVLLMSGYSDLQFQGGPFLLKPFKLADLMQKVHELLALPPKTAGPENRLASSNGGRLEADMLEQVDEARERHALAAAHHKELREQAKGLGWIDADGSKALRQAAEALERYAQLLDTFSNLVHQHRAVRSE
ncbi:MAG TPA: response regulator [Verrucomicrobiae bacterium]|nr:response regulator [Verrucomicrobiae bacterium]